MATLPRKSKSTEDIVPAAQLQPGFTVRGSNKFSYFLCINMPNDDIDEFKAEIVRLNNEKIKLAQEKATLKKEIETVKQKEILSNKKQSQRIRRKSLR